MADVATNRRLYAFNAMDDVLLGLADRALSDVQGSDGQVPEAGQPVKVVANQHRQPDMAYAARGFAAVALVRAHCVDVDLNALADSYANSLYDDGCSELHAISAQWGGVTSKGADLIVYENMIETYVDLMNDEQRVIPSDKTDPRSRFNMAASTYLAAVMATAPNEFERFLKHIGRSDLQC